MENKDIQKFIKNKIKELQNIDYWIINRELEHKMYKISEENEFLIEENKRLKILENVAKDDISAKMSILTLHEIEKLAIKSALQVNKGDKTKAANQLGIMIKTLYNKLHEYGEFHNG